MIGGTVWDVFRFEPNRMTIVVRGHDEEHNQFLAVDVVDSGEGIAPGDGLWWQSHMALWSTNSPSASDIQLERIGYSYDAQVAWLRAVELCIAGICPVCGETDTMHSGTGGLWCPRCGASFGALERVEANDVLRQVRDLLKWE